MKKLIIALLMLSGCYGPNSPPNHKSKVAVSTQCGTSDTLSIIYFNTLEIGYSDGLIDANGSVFAKGVRSFSVIQDEVIK